MSSVHICYLMGPCDLWLTGQNPPCELWSRFIPCRSIALIERIFQYEQSGLMFRLCSGFLQHVVTIEVLKTDTVNLRVKEVNHIENVKVTCACVHIEGVWGSGVLTPFIPKLGTKWWTVSFTWRALWPRARTVIVYWTGGCAPGPLGLYKFYRRENFLSLQRVAPRFFPSFSL